MIINKRLDDNQLPTLSICIPARNESNDLRECLNSILLSKYPKLEILVLDDCSQTNQTANIIKEYAHSGVRFIQGEMPSSHWLAKNWAYQQLLDQVSGEMVLFCGVDTRFFKDSFYKLVLTMKKKNKKMLSIMPDYSDKDSFLRIFQPLRYFWELAPPRRLFNRPPVLSSCWICNTADFRKVGGFNANTRSVVPESYFARLFTKSDSYSFIRSNKYLGVSSYKSINDQRDTFIRVRYPQLHKKPEYVFMICLLQSVFWVIPFFELLVPGKGYLLIIDLITCCLVILNYGLVISRTFPTKTIISALLFPIGIILDMVLLNYSMYKYEFSEVSWKSRNICIPAMHINGEPHKL